MTSPSTIQNLKSQIDRFLGWMLVLLMGVAVVNVLWQVFTRFVLADPSSFTDELARFLLIWIGLLGASYATSKRLHLAIDLLPMRLKGRAHHMLMVVIEGFVFLFALFVMIMGGSKLVWLTFLLGQTSAALQVPLGYVYLVLPFSGALILFYSVLFMLEQIHLLRGGPSLLIENTAPPHPKN